MTGDRVAPAGLASRLRAVDGLVVLDDPEVLESYRRDQAPGVYAGAPAAVVLPVTSDQVSAVVQLAAAAGAPVVPRGAGSGLAGGANAVDGCVILSTARMNRILDVDPRQRLAIVQPGVLTGDLRRAAAAAGLFYPPDPGSVDTCTVGGNVATNAGGMCCLKYGVTADYVRALEVVLADGTVMRTGRRTVKGVAGYDLTRLLVGSEGTLGVVTEVTLALRRAPESTQGVVAQFASTRAAAEAATEAAQSSAHPSLLEILDSTTLRAIEQWRPVGVEQGTDALLIAQCDSADSAAQSEQLERIFTSSGATAVLRSETPAESHLLLEARRLAYPALERLGATLLDDVAVPLPALGALITGVERISAQHGLTVGMFGHAGDGNMHPTVVYERGSASAQAQALACFDDIVRLALDLGGTSTGEHGVGMLKRHWLGRELDPAATAAHRAIKSALDPAGTLNPGKALPPAEGDA